MFGDRKEPTKLLLVHTLNCPVPGCRLQSIKVGIPFRSAFVFTYQVPPRQPLEMRWTIAGIHYRVMPSFFLITALLAFFFIGRLDLVAIAVDVACIFFAVVFTELIQGLVYRSYGIRSQVVIQEFMGGIYPERDPPTAFQRIMVALANPISCFMLLALVYYTNDEFGWSRQSPYAMFAYQILLVVGLIWGIIGLLPIFPYPGGRVMLELLMLASPRKGLLATLWISIILGVLYIIYMVGVYLRFLPVIQLPGGAWLPIGIFLAIFMAIATVRNWQLLQEVRSQLRIYRSDDYGDRAPWER